MSKVLRKPVDEYRSMFPHVVAIMQMAQKGKRMKRGETIVLKEKYSLAQIRMYEEVAGQGYFYSQE